MKPTRLTPCTVIGHFGAALCVWVLAGCAASHPPKEQTDKGELEEIETNNCTSREVDEPGNSGEKGVPVCIVFNSDGCPTKTVFAGLLNGEPQLERGAALKRLLWQAVTEGSSGTYSNFDIDYSLVFDPLKGNVISSKKGGWAKSRPLQCQNGTDLTKCIPAPAEFKYTVWTPENASCAPLDPMFRVN